MLRCIPVAPSGSALRRVGVHALAACLVTTQLSAVHAQPADSQQQPASPQQQANPQQPAASTRQQPARNEATLNFVGADIESVIKAIGHYTNNTFIVDPRVKGTINLVAENPVSKPEALRMLTQALRLQGYAVVNADGVYKVVPEADAKLQAGPVQRGPIRGDQIATQVFRLNYENAVNLVPVLRPLISPNNTISANANSNSLIVTDYGDNLRRIGRIISALDNPATSNFEVVPLKHAIASDLAVTLGRLLEPGPVGPGGEAGRIGVLADTRTNSIIVRAPSTARANFAKSLIASLDMPTATPGNVHVVHLRNAEATRLAQTLRAVVAADPSLTAQSQNATGTPQANTTQVSATGQTTPAGSVAGLGTPPSSPTPQQGPLPTGGAAGFIQADAATNTLIITANEAVYRNLRAVIDKLDARRAQVYVESLIVEVSSERAAEFGIQWAGLSGDSTSRYRIGSITGFSTLGNNLINQAVARATTGNPVAPGNGLNLGIFRQIGGELTLGAIARALESDDGANILSMPNLITLDNEEARIIVGQNVPFITGQYTTAASGGAAGVNPFQTVERRDIGLSLRVRPQISEGGTVKMAIYQETSAIQDSSNSAGLITSKRSIDTNVLVDDGQIIVLGGLIDDNSSTGEEKVPGLGDVPVVGNLFKYQRRSRVKTNLMVFLRPTIIRTNEQSVNVANDRYNFIRQAESGAQPKSSWILPELGAPQLPPMDDGRIMGSGVMAVPPESSGVFSQPQAPATPGYSPPGPAPTDPALDLRPPRN